MGLMDDVKWKTMSSDEFEAADIVKCVLCGGWIDTKDAVHVHAKGLAPTEVAKVPRRNWPGPTPGMIVTPEFEAVWQCIKGWDINVPDVYVGYMGANGNHVRAILDALAKARG